MTIKVLTFAGSMSEGSLNRKIASTAANFISSLEGAEPLFIELIDYPLPIYGYPDAYPERTKKNLESLTGFFRESHALFMSNPEYNGFFPPLIKNLFDWISRKEMSVFSGKPAAIASASPGKFGGVRSLIHSRQLLANLGFITYKEMAFPLAKPGMFDPKEGTIVEGNYQEDLEALLTNLISLTKKLCSEEQ